MSVDARSIALIARNAQSEAKVTLLDISTLLTVCDIYKICDIHNIPLATNFLQQPFATNLATAQIILQEIAAEIAHQIGV